MSMMLWRTGSYGARIGANKAITMNARMISRPIRAIVVDQSAPKAARRPRGGVLSTGSLWTASICESALAERVFIGRAPARADRSAHR